MEIAHAESAAPVERLWDVVSDVGAWPEILPTFTSVRHVGGPNPTALGSRYEVRQPGLATAVYEVTEWEPGRAFTWAARSPGVTTTASHTTSPTSSGSRVDLAIEWTGPLAQVVRLLLGSKARRMMHTEGTTFAQLAERR